MKLNELIGKIGKDYNDVEGKIVDAVHFKDWESITEHDTAGWMSGEEFDDMLEHYSDDDILVAMETADGGYFGGVGTNVYVYGSEGVELL